MAEKKEKKAHENLIDMIHSHEDKVKKYTYGIEFENRQIITQAEGDLLKKLGSTDALYNYLSSSKGKQEHAKYLADQFHSSALKKLNIGDESKLHEFDRDRLIEFMYGTNKDLLENILQQTGPRFNISTYQKVHLDKHLESLTNQSMTKLYERIDEKEIPNVFKHIEADKHLTVNNLDFLANKTYIPSVVNAVLNKDNLSNYLAQDKQLNMYLKKQYD